MHAARRVGCRAECAWDKGVGVLDALAIGVPNAYSTPVPAFNSPSRSRSPPIGFRVSQSRGLLGIIGVAAGVRVGVGSRRTSAAKLV